MPSRNGWIVYLPSMAQPSVPVFIRSEEPEDLPLIDQINLAAFGRSGEGKLIRALRESDAWLPGLSLLAATAEEVIGHLLFTRIHIVGDGQVWPTVALAPMAVLPDWQGQQIGTLLVQVGLQTVAREGHDSVIVLGHPDYYPRFGFVPASQWGIRCPFPVPGEAFMALELEEGSLSAKAGTVRYSKPFTEIS